MNAGINLWGGLGALGRIGKWIGFRGSLNPVKLDEIVYVCMLFSPSERIMAFINQNFY